MEPNPYAAPQSIEIEQPRTRKRKMPQWVEIAFARKAYRDGLVRDLDTGELVSKDAPVGESEPAKN